MDIIFHYPPELFNLLVDAIPLLFRSKKDVLLFFKGASVSSALTNDLEKKVNHDRESINKYEITRTVLKRLNEKGESTLRERREILKRVTEFDNFSTCWPVDQLKAKGLVAEIRRVINIKDSFTRMKQERDNEKMKHQKEKELREKVKKELFDVFKENNAQKRGRTLEGVLNNLFKIGGILVREPFTLKGASGEGIIEQIDGVIEIEGAFYLVEMKWWNEPLGIGDVSQHLVRVFNRGYARGIFISVSGYTESAIQTCKESLTKTVVVLCKLEEFVKLLEQEYDLKELFKVKINAAIIDKNPLYEPI